MGLYPARGTVRKDGQPLKLNDARGAIRVGLAFVSEDRRGVGILPDESIELNIALTAIEAQNRFLLPGPIDALRLLDGGAVRRHAREMIQRLDIRCTGPRQTVRRLSRRQPAEGVSRARDDAASPTCCWCPSRHAASTSAPRSACSRSCCAAEPRAGHDAARHVLRAGRAARDVRPDRDRLPRHVEAVLPPDASDRDFGLAMAGELERAGVARVT